MTIQDQRDVNTWLNHVKVMAEEMKVGEEREHKGIKVVAKIHSDEEEISCPNCIFKHDCCGYTSDLIGSTFGECLSDERSDKKRIEFVKVSIDKDKF